MGSGGGREGGGGGRVGGGGGGGVCLGGSVKRGVALEGSAVIPVMSAVVRLGGMNGGRDAWWSRKANNRSGLDVLPSLSCSSVVDEGGTAKGGRLGLSPGRRKGKKGRRLDASSLPGRRGGRTGGRCGSVRRGAVVGRSVVVEGVVVVVVVIGVVVVVGLSVTSSGFRFVAVSSS